MTALTPDLRAAANAAGRSQNQHQHGAAYHLVPQMFTAVSGRRYRIDAHHDLAEEHAWAALADKYEVRALDAAARGETDR